MAREEVKKKQQTVETYSITIGSHILVVHCLIEMES